MVQQKEKEMISYINENERLKKDYFSGKPFQPQTSLIVNAQLTKKAKELDKLTNDVETLKGKNKKLKLGKPPSNHGLNLFV